MFIKETSNWISEGMRVLNVKILTLAKVAYIQKFKQNFLRNYCAVLNQILHERITRHTGVYGRMVYCSTSYGKGEKISRRVMAVQAKDGQCKTDRTGNNMVEQ